MGFRLADCADIQRCTSYFDERCYRHGVHNLIDHVARKEDEAAEAVCMSHIGFAKALITVTRDTNEHKILGLKAYLETDAVSRVRDRVNQIGEPSPEGGAPLVSKSY